MAGKTRLAAARVHDLLPGAALLAPLPGTALRELVDNRLDLADTVVWLDDLERFLIGEGWLDPVLLDALLADGATVVATIRRNALEVYRPRNDARPPQWETISRFNRVDLARRLSAEESRTVDADVSDSGVRAAIHRYGLAEYLGAGPDAVDRFDSGETECPVGAALVRAAIDWRRAGLARLIKGRDLRAALPIYLRDRPDLSVDEASVTAGFHWATEKINETVALLVPNYGTNAASLDVKRQDEGLPLYEVFDYLVDVLAERAVSGDRAQRDNALIPVDMYRIVGESASRAERTVLDMAARTQFEFFGRTQELAELTSWLASSVGSSPPLGILYGPTGIGKSVILRRLQELANPRTRELIAGDPTQPLLNVPHIDAGLAARGRTATELMAAICNAAGIAPSPGETVDACTVRVRAALSGRDRPVIITIDMLDEASDPEQTMRMLLDLYRGDSDLPLRILASARERPPQIGGAVRTFELGAGNRQDLVEYAQYHLVAGGAFSSAELADQTVQMIADVAQGSFLWAAVLVTNVVTAHERAR